jgi:hypothetical protein
MNKEYTCINCWWIAKAVRPEAQSESDEVVFQCRSNSPTRTKVGFPLVKPNEWCKKFLQRLCSNCYGRKVGFESKEPCSCNSVFNESERAYLLIFEEHRTPDLDWK